MGSVISWVDEVQFQSSFVVDLYANSNETIIVLVPVPYDFLNKIIFLELFTNFLF